MNLKTWLTLECVPICSFLADLRECGIRMDDPRVHGMIQNMTRLSNVSRKSDIVDSQVLLDQATFKSSIASSMPLIAKAFRHQLVIPDFAGFTKDIAAIHEKCKNNKRGTLATYIPQLSHMNPKHWGVSVCTIDGQRYSTGDTDIPFTIQSCSKPLTYAIALEILGHETVHQYVGQEPSGRNFNELILDYNKKPHNPMINAGAILVCALLKTLVKPEMTLAEKFQYTQQWFLRMSGGEPIGFNYDVFLSEREVADRNFALGFYMREHKCFPKDSNLHECLDLYFQCCSMESTCEPMSVIAATLANGGVCPLTEDRVFRTDVIRDVLSLSASCGMYDYSGQFAFKVGLPAKSGVCGGMLLVIPNVMGIFTWSPPLDASGNSCRGLQFCDELVKNFNFHRYDNMKNCLPNKKNPRHHRLETRQLILSAVAGDLAGLQGFREAGMDFTMSDYDGRTVLHFAASGGHLACVKFVLEQCGVAIDGTDRWGNTPLDEAETFGRNDVALYLREHSLPSQRN